MKALTQRLTRFSLAAMALTGAFLLGCNSGHDKHDGHDHYEEPHAEHEGHDHDEGHEEGGHE